MSAPQRVTEGAVRNRGLQRQLRRRPRRLDDNGLSKEKRRQPFFGLTTWIYIIDGGLAADPGVVLCVADGIVRIAAGIIRVLDDQRDDFPCATFLVASHVNAQALESGERSVGLRRALSRKCDDRARWRPSSGEGGSTALQGSAVGLGVEAMILGVRRPQSLKLATSPAPCHPPRNKGRVRRRSAYRAGF